MVAIVPGVGRHGGRSVGGESRVGIGSLGSEGQSGHLVRDSAVGVGGGAQKGT